MITFTVGRCSFAIGRFVRAGKYRSEHKAAFLYYRYASFDQVGRLIVKWTPHSTFAALSVLVLLFP